MESTKIGEESGVVRRRLFKLQVTETITSAPKWIELIAESPSQAQNMYWADNPRHYICATIDIEDNPDFKGF